MNQKRNCIYIPTIDAKDIYLANCLKEQANNRMGFQLLTKSGSVSYRRFISTLDFSLDSEKIREIAATVYDKKDDFSFYDDGKEYSDKVINVTFQYSSRTFNKMEKNTYVREGYLPNDLVFEDNISVDGNTIVGIIVSTPTKHRTERPLPDGFDFGKDENGDDV